MNERKVPAPVNRFMGETDRWDGFQGLSTFILSLIARLQGTRA